MILTAIIEPTPTGFSGYVVELGGQVIAVGDSADEVAQLLKEATQEIVRDLRREGKSMPSSPVLVRALEIV